ncbi:MAG: hypothetical protein IH599_07645, partial [Bacteroidales bacterium]|nr:hypothetical protein [Bacteroidales bacterium]
MKFVEIRDHQELIQHLRGREQAYALLYIEGSEKSFCALDNIRNSGKEDLEVMTVDVSRVRDIHTQYGVSSAPSLL